jgi:hypothetical protein
MCIGGVGWTGKAFSRCKMMHRGYEMVGSK